MRYVVIVQNGDECLSVVLITRDLEKAQRKADKITDAENQQYAYVETYEKEVPNKNFKFK